VSRSLSPIPAALAALLLAACTAIPTAPATPTGTSTPRASVLPSASITPTGSITPTESLERTGSVEPTPSSEPTSGLGPFTCGSIITLPAAGTGQPATTEVRTGLHPGYDRLVFEYAGGRRPGLTIEAATPPFMLDPSGLPLTVKGARFVRIRLDGIVVGYAGATSFAPGGPFLVDVERQGEYEGQQSWIVGLTAGACPRAFGLTGPSRWVVDFGSP